jgi:polysaccharide biosynthesis/export protein
VTAKFVVRNKVAAFWHDENRTFMAIAFLCVTCILSGCSSSADNESEMTSTRPTALSQEQCAQNAAIMHASTKDGTYVVQSGDELAINFYLNQEFNQDVTVRPDGKIALEVVGVVDAAGATPQELAQRIDQAYSTELRNPGASVTVRNMPNREVFVQGQVAKPGAFPLQSGMTAVQAISEAGGLNDNAGDQAVLIRRDACGIPASSKISLKGAKDGEGVEDDAALEPRDVIVVPRSGIANADLWVKQHIKDLLPVDPYLGAAPAF